jgi:hypothetical protein
VFADQCNMALERVLYLPIALSACYAETYQCKVSNLSSSGCLVLLNYSEV